MSSKYLITYFIFLNCLLPEDSSDPSDLGLEVDEYNTPVANSNKGHPQSQSQGETTGSGGRKLRENVKEIVMAMQQLEKER